MVVVVQVVVVVVSMVSGVATCCRDKHAVVRTRGRRLWVREPWHDGGRQISAQEQVPTCGKSLARVRDPIRDSRGLSRAATCSGRTGHHLSLACPGTPRVRRRGRAELKGRWGVMRVVVVVEEMEVVVPHVF